MSMTKVAFSDSRSIFALAPAFSDPVVPRRQSNDSEHVRVQSLEQTFLADDDPAWCGAQLAAPVSNGIPSATQSSSLFPARATSGARRPPLPGPDRRERRSRCRAHYSAATIATVSVAADMAALPRGLPVTAQFSYRLGSTG